MNPLKFNNRKKFIKVVSIILLAVFICTTILGDILASPGLFVYASEDSDSMKNKEIDGTERTTVSGGTIGDGKAGSEGQALVVELLPTLGDTAFAGEYKKINLKATYSSSNVGGATTRIHIKDPDLIIGTPFLYSDTYEIGNGSGGTVVLTLNKENPSDRYIEFALKDGETFNTDLHFMSPNGRTENNHQVEFTSECTNPTEGDVNSLGGCTYTVNSAFSWKNVTLTGAPSKAEILETALKADIPYIITTGPDEIGALTGVIYTKFYTVKSVITLPAGLTFIDGTSYTYDAAAKSIMCGSTKVLTFDKALPSAPTITGTPGGNTIEISFRNDYDYSSWTGDVSAITTAPAWKMTLSKDGVAADESLITGNDKIKNEISFSAEGYVGGGTASSTAFVETTVEKPAAVISAVKANTVVKARKNDGKVRVDDVIKYTITFKNTGNIKATGDVTDIIPAGTELITSYTDNSGNNVTCTPTAGYVEEGGAIKWKAQNLPAGGTKTYEFHVMVNGIGLTEGASIANTAQWDSASGNKTSNTVENTYAFPIENLAITKSAKAPEHSGTLLAGSAEAEDTIDYEVTITNTGDKEAADKQVVDTLPKYMILTTAQETKIKTDYPGTTVTRNADGTIIITFPKVTLTKDTGLSPAKTYKYQADLKDAAALAGLGLAEKQAIINTAELRPNGISAAASIQYHIPASKLKIVKRNTGEQIVDEGSGKFTKIITFELKVTNEGDFGSVADTLKDTMRTTYDGGKAFVPGLRPADYGTGAGVDITQTNGTFSHKLKNGSSAETDGSAAFTKTADNIYGVEFQVPALAAKESYTVKYKAAVTATKNDANVIWTNGASIGTILSNGSNGTGPKPVLEADKKITKIDSGAAVSQTSCEIKPGNVIEYTLTVKNISDVPCDVTVNDILPVLSNHRWKLSPDVGGNVEVSAAAGENGFGTAILTDLGALQWTTVSVPKQSTVTQKIRLTYPEGADYLQAFTWSNGAASGMKNMMEVTPLWAGINQIDKEVSHNANEVSLQVTKTADRNELKAGDKVTFTLNDFGTTARNYSFSDVRLEDDLSNLSTHFDLTSLNVGTYRINPISSLTPIITPELVLHYADSGSTKSFSIDITGNTEVIVPAADLKNVTKIEWKFGNVDTMEIVKAPSIEMTTKRAVVGKVTNKAVVSYGPNCSAEASADVSVVMGQDFIKKAMRNGQEVDNTSNQLNMDEDVNFILSYHNTTTGDIDLTDISITDRLQTKAMVPGTYQIQAEVNGSSVSLNNDSFTIASGETTKNLSIGFTTGTLPQGQTLIVSYTLKTGDGYKEAANEYNKAQLAGQEIDDIADKSAFVHNEAMINVKGAEMESETGWYYPKLRQELYFQKSISNVGRIENNSYTSLRNQYKDITNYSEDANAAVFAIVIYNDIYSGVDLPVSDITDELPAGFTLAGLSSGKINDGAISLSNSITTAQGVSSNLLAMNGNHLIQYQAVPVTAAQNGNTVTFKTGGNDGTLLKPGQAVVFAYAVNIGAYKRGPVSNSAYLTYRGSGGPDIANISFTNGEAKGNGSCSMAMAGGNISYKSSVNMDLGFIIPGAEKTIVSYKQDTNPNWESYTAASIPELDTFTAIEWEITVSNAADALVTMKNYEITDILPYPYEMKSGEGMIMRKSMDGGAHWTDITSQVDKELLIDPIPTTPPFGEPYHKLTYTSKPGDALAPGGSIKLRVQMKVPNSISRREQRIYTNQTWVKPSQSFLNATSGEIILDAANRNESVRAAADVYILGKFASVSVAEVAQTEYGVGDEAKGNESQNYIWAGKPGSEVRYSMVVDNVSGINFSNIVLIDKLPYIGDGGVVNTNSRRGSEYSMHFAENPQIEVFTQSMADPSAAPVPVSSDNYLVSYSDKTDAYSENEWKGTDNTGWGAMSASSRTMRMTMTNGFELRSQYRLLVRFRATLDEDARENQIAWNTFGYRYEGTDAGVVQAIKAEPAKIGVLVNGAASPTLTVEGSKLWAAETPSAVRPSGIRAQLMQKNGRTGAEQVYNYPDGTVAEVVLNGGNNWSYKFENLPSYDTAKYGYTYYMQEIGVPQNYYSSIDGYNIVNTWQEAGASLQAQKKLMNGTLTDGQFTFELLDNSGSVLQTKTNSANGGIAFDSIIYHEPGVHTYTLREKAGIAADYSYDRSTYKAVVTVERNTTDNKLSASVRYENEAGNETVGGVTFYNAYKADGTFMPMVHKQLLGAGGMNAGEFEFILSSKDAGGRLTEIERKTNDASGIAAFAPIQFSAADVGHDFTYVITEVSDSNKPWYTYDTVQYEIKVEVQNIAGTIIASASANDQPFDEMNDIIFRNQYTAQGSLSVDALKTTKDMKLKKEQFTFLLQQFITVGNARQNIGTPLTEKNDADGKIHFELAFTQEDAGKTYTYLLTEQNDGQKNVGYDETAYVVTVKVTDKGQSVLEAVAEYTKETKAAVSKVTELTFLNVHQEETAGSGGNGSGGGSGDDSGSVMAQIKNLFSQAAGAKTGDETPIILLFVILAMVLLVGGGYSWWILKAGKKNGSSNSKVNRNSRINSNRNSRNKINSNRNRKKNGKK